MSPLNAAPVAAAPPPRNRAALANNEAAADDFAHALDHAAAQAPKVPAHERLRSGAVKSKTEPQPQPQPVPALVEAKPGQSLPPQERIKRIWLIPDGVPPPPGIEAEYRGTRAVLLTNGDFLARLPVADSPRDHIYVIDPFGNLMMRFPRNVDPQRMKKDVEKLMKNSSGWIRTAK